MPTQDVWGGGVGTQHGRCWKGLRQDGHTFSIIRVGNDRPVQVFRGPSTDTSRTALEGPLLHVCVGVWVCVVFLLKNLFAFFFFFQGPLRGKSLLCLLCVFFFFFFSFCVCVCVCAMLLPWRC